MAGVRNRKGAICDEKNKMDKALSTHEHDVSQICTNNNKYTIVRVGKMACVCVFLMRLLSSPVQLNSAKKPFSICRFSDQNILHFIANRILPHVVETKIDGNVYGVVVLVLGVTITTYAERDTHTHRTRIATFQV